MEQAFTLDRLASGESACVAQLTGTGAMRSRLCDLGFTENSRVTCLFPSAFGDPQSLPRPGHGGGASRLRRAHRFVPCGRRRKMSALRVALCGNPNVGKSTVFNALTGLRQHTGNWAGKTVDTARGQVRGAEADWTLTDLPGAYSLLSGSPEEMVASDCLTFEAQDAVIVVCDATCLERNLNLALQAAEACPRMVLCVNMMDEARSRGLEVDTALLEQLLGLPAVGVSARNRQGLDRAEAARGGGRAGAGACASRGCPSSFLSRSGGAGAEA